MIRQTSVIIAVLIAAGCSPSQQSFEEQIVGRWEMLHVEDSGTDVTAEHNPAGNRYIVLREDSSFESGGDPFGINSGQWSFVDSTAELYLDSDAGEDDDSYWMVSWSDSTMTWQGTRFEFAMRFKIVHVKSGE